MIFKKGSKLYSIFKFKCPRCQEGDFFTNKSFYSIKNNAVVDETCSHCNLKFEKEPAFFYGAMYVSYALGIAFGISLFILSHFILELETKTSLIFTAIGMVILSPLTLKWSKIIYMNMFESFDEKFS